MLRQSWVVASLQRGTLHWGSGALYATEVGFAALFGPGTTSTGDTRAAFGSTFMAVVASAQAAG